MIKYTKYKAVKHFVLTVFTLLSFSSCIKDNLDDCYVIFDFEYKHNMSNSNAFADQVDAVTLYVFDTQGALLRRVDENSTQITNDCQIKLNGLAAADYQIVAWARGTRYKGICPDLEMSPTTTGSSDIEQLYAKLELKSGTHNHPLNNILLGYLPSCYINSSTQSRITIPTKKVNSVIRVILVDRENKNLKKDSYKISIEDPKGLNKVKYDFTLSSQSDAFIYEPYYQEREKPGDAEVIHPRLDSDRSIVSEFAILRLIDDSEIKLIVKDQHNNSVLKYCLLDLIKLIEDRENNGRWEFREYLERQDHYSITLYIDKAIPTVIINGWVINNVDIAI